MAFDGSLKFDTKVDTSGFDEGSSTLKNAMEKLTSTIERLSDNITRSFHGAGKAVEGAGSSAENTASQVEEIAKAAKKANDETAALKGQMDEIAVSHGEKAAESMAEPQASHVPGEYQVYGNEVQEFVDNYVKDMGKASESTNEFKSEIESLSGQLKQMESQGLYFGDEEYDEAYFKLAKIKQALADYKREITSPTPDAVIPVKLDSSSFAGQIQELKQELAVLSAKGITLGMPEYDEVYLKLQKVMAAQKQYEAYLKNLAQLSNQTGEAITSEGAAASTTASHMTELAREKAKASTENKKLGNKAEQTSGKLRKEGAGAKWLSAMLGIAAKTLSKVGNRFAHTGRQATSASRGLGSILSKMILFSAIRKIISGITSAFKEGIQNYAQYSSNFNSIMSSFISTTAQLKNSVAAAFSPITSIVIPALDVLAQKLIYVINLIGQFLAALSGKGMFTKAVKVNKDYADGLKKTGGAAKKAGNDIKKSLAPFDELKQIQQQANDSGANGAGGVDPSQMFTESKIDSEISDFAGRIMKAFKAGDFAAIGQIIGEKINDEVQRFTNFISWDNAGAKITAFVTDFTDLFNSLVRTIDWYSIGVMMGTGTNTLVNTLYLLITQLDWGLIGEAFALGLNGTIDTIDWAKIGLLFAVGLGSLFTMASHFAETFDWTGFGSSIALSLSTFFQNFDWAGAGTAVSDIVIGLLDALITFVVETDWWAFGEGVATSLENIDWATVANRLFMAIGAVLGGIAAFLGGLISDGVEAAQTYFQEKIEECGGNVAQGILKGIGDALVGIGAWVKKNVFEPFINGFKDAFGIHSPSTVMAEMGKYLWDGFCNGIKNFFSNPGAFIKTNITDPFVNGIKGLLGIHSPSTVLKEIGGYTVDGFNQGVENGQSNSQSIVQKWASGISNWFTSKLGLSGNNSDESKKWGTGIISGYNGAISQDYTKSQSIMETWADSIRKWFIGDGEGKGVNEAAWKKFADQIINAFKEKIQSGFTDSRAPMESWSNNLRTWFWGDSNYTGTGGLYNVFYMMAKRINEGFANGISDFSNLTKAAMTKWAQGAIQEAKEGLDIHSPSRESYSIAEYFIQGFNNGISDMAKSSAGAVKSWLDGVKSVLDGADLQLSTGINIPNAAAYLPKMAQGVVVPPRAGEYQTLKNSAEGNSFLEGLSALIRQLKSSGGQGTDSGDGNINLNLYLGEDIVYQTVVSKNQQVVRNTGTNPLME